MLEERKDLDKYSNNRPVEPDKDSDRQFQKKVIEVVRTLGEDEWWEIYNILSTAGTFKSNWVKETMVKIIHAKDMTDRKQFIENLKTNAWREENDWRNGKKGSRMNSWILWEVFGMKKEDTENNHHVTTDCGSVLSL